MGFAGCKSRNLRDCRVQITNCDSSAVVMFHSTENTEFGSGPMPKARGPCPRHGAHAQGTEPMPKARGPCHPLTLYIIYYFFLPNFIHLYIQNRSRDANRVISSRAHSAVRAQRKESWGRSVNEWRRGRFTIIPAFNFKFRKSRAEDSASPCRRSPPSPPTAAFDIKRQSSVFANSNGYNGNVFQQNA